MAIRRRSSVFAIPVRRRRLKRPSIGRRRQIKAPRKYVSRTYRARTRSRARSLVGRTGRVRPIAISTSRLRASRRRSSTYRSRIRRTAKRLVANRRVGRVRVRSGRVRSRSVPLRNTRRSSRSPFLARFRRKYGRNPTQAGTVPVSQRALTQARGRIARQRRYRTGAFRASAGRNLGTTSPSRVSTSTGRIRPRRRRFRPVPRPKQIPPVRLGRSRLPTRAIPVPRPRPRPRPILPGRSKRPSAIPPRVPASVAAVPPAATSPISADSIVEQLIADIIQIIIRVITGA